MDGVGSSERMLACELSRCASHGVVQLDADERLPSQVEIRGGASLGRRVEVSLAAQPSEGGAALDVAERGRGDMSLLEELDDEIAAVFLDEGLDERTGVRVRVQRRSSAMTSDASGAPRLGTMGRRGGTNR